MRERDIQTPRPRNENKNDAYLLTWGGIWNSRSAVAGDVMLALLAKEGSRRTRTQSEDDDINSEDDR
jgi:hypothetical protein